MESIAAWLAGTDASAVIQKTFWIIPVMQTIHIICVAMVFSSVVMIELRVLGVTKSQTIEQIAHRYVPWIFTCVVVMAVTGSILIIGEPQRSLPSYEFQMKMLSSRHRTGIYLRVRAVGGTPCAGVGGRGECSGGRIDGDGWDRWSQPGSSSLRWRCWRSWPGPWW